MTGECCPEGRDRAHLRDFPQRVIPFSVPMIYSSVVNRAPLRSLTKQPQGTCSQSRSAGGEGHKPAPPCHHCHLRLHIRPIVSQGAEGLTWPRVRLCSLRTLGAVFWHLSLSRSNFSVRADFLGRGSHSCYQSSCQTTSNVSMYQGSGTRHGAPAVPQLTLLQVSPPHLFLSSTDSAPATALWLACEHYNPSNGLWWEITWVRCVWNPRTGCFLSRPRYGDKVVRAGSQPRPRASLLLLLPLPSVFMALPVPSLFPSLPPSLFSLSRSLYTDQAGLELSGILLPLPPELG